jgi:hypothetical protein
MTSQLGKAPSRYTELLRLQALPGRHRAITAIILALIPPLIGAWYATVHDRWDVFERSGSLTSAIGLLAASRRYFGYSVYELAALQSNSGSSASGFDELLEDIHAAKVGLAISAFGTTISAWGKYLGWWSFSYLVVWAAIAARDAWRDFVQLRDTPIGVPPAEESNNPTGADS